MNLNYWLSGAIGILITLLFLRLLHLYKRQKNIKCTNCRKVWRVKKVYQMIQLGDGWWEYYVFSKCSDEHVRFIRSENKYFTKKQIARRMKKFPEQFSPDVSLFKKSGLVAGNQIEFNTQILQMRQSARISRLLAKLPN